jgi:hypothetical protein
MIPKKKVTEEDLKATEALLAGSFSNMKNSLTRIPGDMVKPVTSTVKAHPYATMAAAAGAGLIAYLLIRAATPNMVVREVNAQTGAEAKVHRRPSILSQVVSFATPYVVAYVQQEVTRLLARPVEERPIVESTPET